MGDATICFICQDFEKNVGHAAKWCPKNICQKCGQNGHVKLVCMLGLEDFPLPNEILLQIFGYISGKDLEQSAKVSKRFKGICDIRNLDEKKKRQILYNVLDEKITNKILEIVIEIPNFPSNLPRNLSNLNTIFAYPMQQSKVWHASVTPDLRNHLVRKL